MNQLIEYQYFGPVISFVMASRCSNIILEQCEHWQKMSFRNRCQILTANGVVNLTVPVVGGRNQRGPTAGVAIDYGQPWQQQHWRSLESAYNNSPFFSHYADGLKPIVFTPFEQLVSLNQATLAWILLALKWPHQILQTTTFERTATANTPDCRGRFLPSNRLGVPLQPYQQVFEKPFEANLSILDLLFNLGPLAGLYLAQNQKLTLQHIETTV